MLELIVIIAVLLVDQITKIVAADILSTLGGSVSVIEGVFNFTYVKNTGAAFGMLKDNTVILAGVSVIATALIAYLLITQRKRKPVPMPVLMRIAVSLLLAGAVGNLMDRVVLGYVRDMLDFVLIGFAVFNVADSAVCVGAALLVVAGVFTKGGKSYIASLEEAEKESAKRKKKAKQGECACGRCARHDEETRDDCEED